MRVNGAPKVSLNPAISASLSVTYFSSRSSYQPLPCQVSRKADKSRSFVSSEKTSITSIEFRVIHSYIVETAAAAALRRADQRNTSSTVVPSRNARGRNNFAPKAKGERITPTLTTRPIPTARRSNHPPQPEPLLFLPTFPRPSPSPRAPCYIHSLSVCRARPQDETMFLPRTCPKRCPPRLSRSATTAGWSPCGEPTWFARTSRSRS